MTLENLIFNPITYLIAWGWLPFWLFFPGLAVGRWPYPSVPTAERISRVMIFATFPLTLVLCAFIPDG